MNDRTMSACQKLRFEFYKNLGTLTLAAAGGEITLLNTVRSVRITSEEDLAEAPVEWGRGTESKRRHYDFQSYALPTELPRPRGESRELANSRIGELMKSPILQLANPPIVP